MVPDWENWAQVCQVKGAYSDISGIWIFVKIYRYGHFSNQYNHKMWKIAAMCVAHLQAFWGDNAMLLSLFYYVTMFFLISKRDFGWFHLHCTNFAHTTSHIKPSKYDSIFDAKISMCLKKVRGMTPWIRIATFNYLFQRNV